MKQEEAQSRGGAGQVASQAHRTKAQGRATGCSLHRPLGAGPVGTRLRTGGSASVPAGLEALPPIQTLPPLISTDLRAKDADFRSRRDRGDAETTSQGWQVTHPKWLGRVPTMTPFDQKFKHTRVCNRASLVAQLLKSLPVTLENWV